MLTGLWINRLQIIIFFCKYSVASLVIVVIVSGIFFFFLNYISVIRYISKFLAQDNAFPAF